MPRNFSKYQYETSPRKLEPEYTPVKNPYKKKKTTARKIQTVNKNKANEIKKRKMRVIKYIAIGFLIIFGISLRIKIRISRSGKTKCSIGSSNRKWNEFKQLRTRSKNTIRNAKIKFKTNNIYDTSKK